MKFAKELEQDLVPEWRAKYLDYKAGKKKVKAVKRAADRANATPRPPSVKTPFSRYGATSPFTARTKPPSTLRRSEGVDDEPNAPLHRSPAALGVDSRQNSGDATDGAVDPLKKTPPVPIPHAKSSPGPAEPEIQYGSFVPTPPKNARPLPLELPEPAIAPGTSVWDAIEDRPQATRSASMHATPNAYEVGPISSPPRQSTFASLRNRMSGEQSIRARLHRAFSHGGGPLTPARTNQSDVDMAVLDQVRSRQKDLFKWLDNELDKVETFYKTKEDEAGHRLEVLRGQLHEMRDRRIKEVVLAEQARATRHEDERALGLSLHSKTNGHSKDDEPVRPTSRDHLKAWFDPVDRVLGEAKAKAFGPRPGGNSKAFVDHAHDSPEMRAKAPTQSNHNFDQGCDYVRKPQYSDEVPYRTAKRKLKLALQEFYRGMELLKSYALLNRTAFRKLNKKYDKAVNAYPPQRYMSEKVNKSWFVKSDVLDNHLHAVEDLYARYFEGGNRKLASGKLKSALGKPKDQTRSAFQNGLLIGTGAVFGIQGVIYGRDLLLRDDPTLVTQTSYLLQIYGGYFLALYLFCWFCLDCSIWTRHKINYQFVFEFDPRHTLDWRQLAEFPSFMVLLLGLFVWLNFSRYGAPEMYIYYPVILIFLTAAIIFFPAPYLFHRSRKWFVYSHWRLLLAGIYPVEFRDFFLGDMYCSLTYFMSNIELFFCLYATHWRDPTQCNSTHSRLLGFFSALPGIWRALQCLRRYYDTRNVFPHLVNCGKYGMTILYYVTLSLYRINHSKENLILFSTFAALNAVYVSIWDLLMDWSLLQPNASKPLLRDVRGFKNVYWYYTVMVLDPILRFNWIFYSIYTHDLQHSTIVSFLVGFSECTRRGFWTLFRVENEHCSNVARFKASRDVPLPYHVPAESEEDFQRHEHEEEEVEGQTTSVSPQLSRRRTVGTLESQQSPNDLRRRPTPQRNFTKVLADAHTQDFEKKRKPGSVKLSDRDEHDEGEAGRALSSDEEDAEDDEDLLEAEALLSVQRSRETRNHEGR